jgi:trk system potassium uptake protein TrkA
MTRKSVAVVGLGRFGSAVAEALSELGHDVIGVDSDEEKVRNLAETLGHVMQLDATDEKALTAAGLSDVEIAIVSIGENVESSVLIVMVLKELGVTHIIAKATTPLHGRILRRLGVSRVVFPEREMAVRLAHSLAVPNVLDYVELSRDFSIIELPTPQEFVGKTLREVGLRATYGVNLIALKRRAEAAGDMVTDIAPSPDAPLHAGDTLVLLGRHDRLLALHEQVS